MPLEDPDHRRAEVPSALHGERLDRALTELLGGGLSRSQITRRIREGLAKVEGEVVRRTGLPVEAGQRLELAQPELGEDQAFAPPEVLYQDQVLAVLDKPAGLPMHGNYAGDRRPSVARFLVERFGAGLPTNQGAERPGIVHRLDRGTSGVCVVALEQQAFLDLMQQFADREVEKEYQAVCFGRPRFRSDWVDKRLARDEKRPERVRVTRSDGPESRDALTYWELIRRFEGFARLLVRPRTGRTHQIRVHLASIDLPIVGDPLYRARNFGPGMFPPGAPPVARTLL
ncbi:MAG: RluA family pseudouridine synthase, partial [Planctomycetes bacterium]|nr:RluA family pseudouridine synthase [Planctomycetota bacterium]